MPKTTEKENIAKLRELIEEIEDVRTKEKKLIFEVDKLLLRKYPSSDRNTLIIFRYQFEELGDLNKARQMLKEDRIVYET
ncbi:MAG: hypothetical protein OIN87_13665 [Candidatus Methanoperedens sp.]|nr:hypothetical protein [Candidatus Methanoperedens sp.]